MARDPRALLWDAKSSGEAIERFLAGKTFDEYLADEVLRSAVERQFAILGEALSQLDKTGAGSRQSIARRGQSHRVPERAHPRLCAGGRCDRLAGSPAQLARAVAGDQRTAAVRLGTPDLSGFCARATSLPVCAITAD